jgi:hypothetical protein
MRPDKQFLCHNILVMTSTHLLADGKTKAQTSLGFTGTRQGMTDAQRGMLTRLLLELALDKAHHGDCIGSDAAFHDLVVELLPHTGIVVHPPRHLRAFRHGHEAMPPTPFLARYHHIVDESGVLLATPQEDQEQRRSGTWATIRYAIKGGKAVFVIAPDGTVTTHNEKLSGNGAAVAENPNSPS